MQKYTMSCVFIIVTQMDKSFLSQVDRSIFNNFDKYQFSFFLFQQDFWELFCAEHKS